MKYLVTIAMIVMYSLAMGQTFKPDKWCSKLITEDVIRFANDNFPPPPFNQPIVYLRAVPISPKFLATADKLDEGIYVINVNILYIEHPLGLERTLIHELQHVIQFHENRLKLNEDSFLYEGKSYSFDTPYHLRPWEIEAFKTSDVFCN